MLWESCEPTYCLGCLTLAENLAHAQFYYVVPFLWFLEFLFQNDWVHLAFHLKLNKSTSTILFTEEIYSTEQKYNASHLKHWTWSVPSSPSQSLSSLSPNNSDANGIAVALPDEDGVSLLSTSVCRPFLTLGGVCFFGLLSLVDCSNNRFMSTSVNFLGIPEISDIYILVRELHLSKCQIRFFPWNWINKIIYF